MRILNKNIAIFPLVLKIHACLGLPAMTGREISVIKAVLTSFDPKTPVNIFEYGSGYSTLYYSRFLLREARPFAFDSIDNNAQWHQRVREKIRDAGLSGNVSLHLKEFPPFWEKPGWSWETPPDCGKFSPRLAAEGAYIAFPGQLKKEYDLIIVDARFRRRCLEAARDHLSPRGVVVLHDAQKSWYHAPLNSFKYSAFINSGQYFPLERTKYKMWLGSNSNPVVSDLAAKFNGRPGQDQGRVSRLSR